MGAVKSIAIGVVVYFLVVRLLLMAKDEKGVRVYVNRWPEKLDLEDLVYRPVLLKLLPGVCTLVVRFVAELPETVVVFLRDTIFSKSKKQRPVPVSYTHLDVYKRQAITEAAVGVGIDSLLYFVTLKKIHAIDVEKEKEKEGEENHGENP